MNIRWQGALCIAVLALAPGCSRGKDTVLCMVTPKSSNECKTAAEWEAEQAAEFAKQQQYAESLPFDYRDLLQAFLVEYIGSARLPGNEQRYFVNVFGKDIDGALVGKLYKSGIKVLPGSAWTLTDERAEQAGEAMRVKLQLGELKQVAPDQFTVRIGYYCGPRCAGSSEYRLQRDGTTWRILDQRMDWVA